MKKLSILSAIFSLTFIGAASAADITVYYSPSCPHCHHAREFIEGTLVYEYPELKVTQVNVTKPENRDAFRAALTKCEFESGGVPVLVIGDKCEQGYADFMQDRLRQAVEADMTEEQKAVAAKNKAELASDAEKFKSENADRANAIVEYGADVATSDSADAPVASAEKKSESGSTIWFWGLLIVLVAGLGYVLVRSDKKK